MSQLPNIDYDFLLKKRINKTAFKDSDLLKYIAFPVPLIRKLFIIPASMLLYILPPHLLLYIFI